MRIIITFLQVTILAFALASCLRLKVDSENVFTATSDNPNAPFWNGVDSNYYLELTEPPHNIQFKYDGEIISNYYKKLKDLGVNAVRIRLFAVAGGDSDLEKATRLAKVAHEHGLKINLAIFLSDDWADLTRQPASSRWAAHLPSVELVGEEVRAYCKRVAEHFAELEIPIAVYAVGNEIDFGISGFYPEGADLQAHARDKKFFAEIATIVKDGQTGIKSIDADAKFLHHLSYFDPIFLKAHWQFMIDNGVQIDFLGLSLYRKEALEDTKSVFDWLYRTFERPIVIPEYAHTAKEIVDKEQWRKEVEEWLEASPDHEANPGTIDTVVNFSLMFNSPVEGYEGTPNGQAQYLTDVLSWARESKSMKGMFYWSPEGLPMKPIWINNSLFDHEYNSRPGLDALSAGAAQR